MLEEFLDVLVDTVIDSIKLLPFLFITYLIMEYLEHKTKNKSKEIVKKSGKFGPFFGGILGIFPQCGFSTVGSNLYAGRIITLGTLISIFLSTSDEMIPVLVSEAAPIQLIVTILLIKLGIGILIGFLVDFIVYIINKNKKNIDDKESNTEEIIGHMCEHEHCNCEKSGICKSAIKHTISIFIFIFLISLVINTVILFIGEENLANLILNKPIIGPVIAAVVGMIPNCASSVILTKLYIEQVISLGSMISGLLIGSGIGLLVLFKVNKNLKENLTIVTILYIVSVVFGIIIDLLII